MALKETTTELQALLDCVAKDLDKGSKGNKAAAQRVRTGTVKLEKIAKLYRKQSVAFEKVNKEKKMKPAAPKPRAEAKKEAAKKTSKKK